jgi:hypothetical protein
MSFCFLRLPGTGTMNPQMSPISGDVFLLNLGNLWVLSYLCGPL